MRKNKKNEDFEKTIKELDTEMKARTIGTDKHIKIYTVKEVAKILNVDIKEILKLIFDKKVSCVWAGKSIRLREKDISDIISHLNKVEEEVPAPVIYSLNQVSKILQISSRDVNRLIKQGYLKAFKLRPDKKRSPWRIRKEDLEYYISKRLRDKEKVIKG